MQLLDGHLTLAATDLGRFISCRHLTALDLQVALGMRPKPPVYPDPFLELLVKRGVDHEKHYTEKIERDGDEVLDLSDCDGPARVTRCLEAMKAGVPAIYQGALASDGWLGYPDLLRRVDRPKDNPSAFGRWSYEAYDTKLARETRGSTILQLSFYSELLGFLQGAMPQQFHVVTPVRDEPYRVADYAAYYRLVKRRLEGASKSDPTLLATENYPEPVERCDFCRWSQPCDKRRRADDHLSLVAGITRLQRQEFEAHDVKTLEHLGDLGLPIPFKPSRGSKESLAKTQDQARVQLAGRRAKAPIHELLLPVEEGRGLALLPEPSIGDVFLDLEGDHFAAEGGREYLFGMTVVGPRGKTHHIKHWAHTETEEKAAFEAVMDDIKSIWDENPGIHIYHYAPYEPTAFKRLMGRHATRPVELDRMLRAGLFVDLSKVVRQGLRASVESYSIKKLEPFYDFERKADLKKATGARGVVEFALETEDLDLITPQIRDLVADYNQEDCVSALKLRDWLETLRADLEESGTAVPRPELKDGEASEKTQERDAEVRAAMDALLKDVPSERKDRTDKQQARWLLANMLEFHRREEKATWWEFFKLSDTEKDDLLDERMVLSGLKLISSQEPTGRKKCRINRYEFPPQPFEGRVRDDLVSGDRRTLGTIVGLDRAKRQVEVRIRQNRDDDAPEWAFAHREFESDVLPKSLLRLAESIGKHGFSPRSGKSVARELLLRNTKGVSLRKGEDLLDAARRAVRGLDCSVLPIQGPPGSGKTYSGARMILECIDKGLKVGVSGPSHKVILNLVEEVLKAAKEVKKTIRCVHKNGESGAVVPGGVDETTDNEEALAAAGDRTADVVSGTPWLWAREDAAGVIDVLFVDEAGQVSLANVLAMAQAAKSIVLLGDPQQLQQPLRASHPEGVDVSALEHILGEEETMPGDRGIFLDKTWRLAPTLCEFTSELFYENRLEPRESLAGQRLSGCLPYEGAGLWFVPVEHDGNTNSSPEEVEAVESIVAKLLKRGSSWTNQKGETKQMTKNDILVVAPFNAQVNRLQEALEPTGVQVGTVDRFQGREAAVVVYSMATSRPEDAPRGMEFLYDLNRLNVATSRARCACILVASPRLFEPDCKSPNQMKLANAMCRYFEIVGTQRNGA